MMIAHLTLSQSPHLEVIINLLNKKLGPIQDKSLCEEIGHYLANVGHFYLDILQQRAPVAWVVASLKRDIARKEIERKDLLPLDNFEQALGAYRTKTNPQQFLKTLYTLYGYA